MERKTPFAPDEYYHIYNRGVMKRKIFLDQRDWSRFLFLITHFQAPLEFNNIGRFINNYDKQKIFKLDDDKITDIVNQRNVDLIGFALMPNHFHLIIGEIKENGISRYLHKLSTAYAKYFNTKYKVSGHLFQGNFRAVHIKDNEQLLYVSAYIHRNPTELSKWRGQEVNYPWSSFQDYAQTNRWGKLLKTDLVLDQFKDGKEYRQWVNQTGIKELGSKCATSDVEQNVEQN